MTERDYNAEAARLVAQIAARWCDNNEPDSVILELIAAWGEQIAAEGQRDCDALSALVDKHGTRADQLQADLAAARAQAKAARDELHAMKIKLSREAGYLLDRCACVFADDDEQITECNTHRDQRQAARETALRELMAESHQILGALLENCSACVLDRAIAAKLEGK